jgi:hypothetical protein
LFLFDALKHFVAIEAARGEGHERSREHRQEQGGSPLAQCHDREK